MADDYYGIGGDFASPDWWNTEYDFATNFAPSNWWQTEEFLQSPVESSSWTSPNYSLSTPGPTEGIKYTPTDSGYTLAEPTNQGSGLNVQDFQYNPSTNEFVYTGGGGTGSGLSFSGNVGGAGATSGMPTSISATSAGGGIPSGSNSGSIIDKAVAAAKQLLNGSTKSGGASGGAGGISDLALALAKLYATVNPSFADPKSVSGYQGGVPKYTAMRQQLAQAPYKAYSGSSEPVMGKQRFTPMTYAAEGGIMELARGGRAKPPRYLDGATDGMADKINTDIDGKQRAKLSHGEFVIPADVVSHLGNGNSKAGADALYKMMSRVRKARTGNPKQGKQINPEKFTPGGVAGYAGGGAVAFVEGGQAIPGALEGTSSSSSLSNWAGPTVTKMIGQAEALANKPYEAYTGPLAAGTSPLQTQAFNTASSMPTSYGATQFNSGLGPVGSVQSYMNPYMQGAVDVQNTEARRQADISRTADASRLTKAGAYGGGRQAVMESLGNEALARLQNQNQLTGLNTAYDKAVQERLNTANLGMTAQQNTEASKQFGAGYGLSALGAQLGAGDKQRAIEQQGIDASRAQFEEERASPYKNLQFLQTMFSGMPVATSTTTANSSSAGRLEDLLATLKVLFP